MARSPNGRRSRNTRSRRRFLVQVSNSGKQWIIERNHSDQVRIITVNYRKPCETCLGHTQNGGAQRFISRLNLFILLIGQIVLM